MIINNRRILENRLDSSQKEILQFKATFEVTDKAAKLRDFEPLFIEAKSEHAAWNKALLQFENLYPEIDLGLIEVVISRPISEEMK